MMEKMKNMGMDEIKDVEWIALIKEILEIEKDVSEETELNIFEYDSLSKINLIVAIEAYCGKRIDINKFLLCDTFEDLLNLIYDAKGND